MSNINNLKKMWLNSLSFLDNCTINSIIVIILLLFASKIFKNINHFVGKLYNYSIIRVIVLLLIIYVAPKDVTIAILLSICYIISLHYMKHHKHHRRHEGFNDETEHYEGFNDENEHNDEGFTMKVAV